MIFGVDYYPEHWDRSEWENQAKLMREGGFNTVRMGEFAWKLFERREGEFDFSFLDEAIEVLAKEGIKTILGTPTAAPPKWLVTKYDVLLRDKYGRKREWGSRRECCSNSPDYIEKSKIIVREMAKHYKDNENVIAYQIDNEFGCHDSTRCYCEHCKKAFSKWLEEKYKTIENLNEKWGTVFWSLQYDSFDEVILPGYTSCEGTYGNLWAHNPALDLEFSRFSSDSWVKYQKMQIDILREYTSVPVTHNLMGHHSSIDYYKLSHDLDFVSWDNYPDNQWGTSEYEYVSMAHEIMRGVKDKNFIVMEEQAGAAGWDIVGQTPRPGQLRLWTYQALAHGGEGMVYFRFRSALFGMEQYWHGVLDHDGVPRRRFYELQKTGKELQRLEKYFVDNKNNYDVLIEKSYDNLWAHGIKSHAKGYNYENHLYSFYKANADKNVMCAVSRGDYDRYKVVYLPAYNIVEDGKVEKLTEYVKNGGTLVLTFRSGVRGDSNEIKPLALPGVFSELAGISVDDFDAPRRPVKIKGKAQGNANIWCDIITPKTAKTIATYDSEYYKGNGAITQNEYGKGRVFYIGCDLDGEAMAELVGYINETANVNTVSAPYGVEVIRRNDCTILLNHNEEETEVNVKGYSVLNECEFTGKLDGYGVEVLKR